MSAERVAWDQPRKEARDVAGELELVQVAAHELRAVPRIAPQAGVCRRCECTEEDCSGCIERTGEPCYWVKPDLCSACADFCEGFF